MKQGLLLAILKNFKCHSPSLSMGERLQKRAAIVALDTEKVAHRSIAAFTATDPKTVRRWVKRFHNADSLLDSQRCGRPRHYGVGTRLKVIAVYCQQKPPLPGVLRWSLRDAEKYFKEHPEILNESISKASIRRILKEHALRPHLSKYYLQITDPDFFPKMEHIINCYSRQLPYLYCFDECTGIQALKRLTPNLPAGPDQPELEDFDYIRNGTTDLLAFFNPATGKVYGQCTENHNRHTLCQTFTTHVQMHPPEAKLHYIMDNLSSHYHDDFCQTVAYLSGVDYTPLKTGPERRQWLQSEHKRIVVHFVPFHASWLNMIEIWFGILKSKCLNYGQFLSVRHLCEAIMSFIGTWNEFYAHPFQWSYTGEGLHSKAVRRFNNLLSLETEQMDAKFLKGQLLLMTNIANQYLEFIPSQDWFQLQKLAVEKQEYINGIIEMDPGPQRQKKAKEAYQQFQYEVLGRASDLEQAA
ncbi:hypothetical protein AKJ60_01255 [candidate division MSBL1 archaeon SCGC-AAA385M11]|nr:hypothetical protein AKJ60_01255 [candidate division MSBL1 archaeon SCGC-AAA385M11]